MNVHAPSPPACTSIARPISPSNSSAIAHHCTGRCEKPKQRADDRARADEPRDADARGEELEDDRARGRRRTGSTRPTACRACARAAAPRSSLWKRTSWFGWRRRSSPSPITSAVSSDDVFAVDASRSAPSSETMKSPTVGWIAFDDVELGARRRRKRPSTTASTLSVLATVRSCAARTWSSTSARDGSPGRRSTPGTTGPMPAPRRDRGDGRRRARAARSRRARRAPDGPTHTAIGTVARREQRRRARRRRRRPRPSASSWTTSSVASRSLGLAHDRRRAARRSADRAARRPATTSMPFARSTSGSSFCAAAGCADREPERRSSDERKQQADSCTGG